MYTYVPEIKTLFTCDSFGSHYAADGILRSEHELQIRGQMLPTGFFDDLKVFYEKHAKLSLAELEAKRNLIDEASKNDDYAAASQ